MTRSSLLRYGIVPLAVAASAFLEYLLEPVIGGDKPFLLLWPGVMVGAWLGGLGPGLLATALAVLVADFLMTEPRFAFGLHKPGELPWACLFTVLGVSLSILSAKIHRLKAESEQRSRELACADQHKNQFLAMLSHELRGPLSTMRLVSARLRLGRPSEADLGTAIGMMDRQIGLMTSIVSDLLDVTRVGQGKIKLDREPIEMTCIVDLAVESHQAILTDQAHHLTLSLPAEPVYVDGDLTRLVQVVGNLLHNAAKFTPRGGQIWLTVDHNGEEVVLKVRDNGTGLSAEALPRLFELFTQIDDSRQKGRAGLGIGLALVRRLVELHGGSVSVQSPGLNQGSLFTVRLPELPGDRIPPGEAALCEISR